MADIIDKEYSKVPKGDKAEEILHEALDRFKDAFRFWSTRYREMDTNYRFVRASDQWPSSIRLTREAQNQPCMTINKTAQYANHVVNGIINNPPAIKLSPIDSNADPKAAEILAGIVRGIEQHSRATAAYGLAADYAVCGGLGFIKVDMRYAQYDAWDKELFIERCQNPFAHFPSPFFNNLNGTDREFHFEVEEITNDEFKRRYPNAQPVNWQNIRQSTATGGSLAFWANYEAKTVRLADYWRVVWEETDIVQVSDGTTYEADEFAKMVEAAGGELYDDNQQPIEITRQRRTKCPRVQRIRMTGHEILEFQEWPGSMIPIVLVPGVEYFIQGIRNYKGLTADARDPQTQYNYLRSTITELLAMQPKAPYIGAAGSFRNFEQAWARSAVDNVAYLEYNPVTVNGQLAPPPQKNQQTGLPPGLAQEAQIAEHDLQTALGMYEATLGARSNETSGTAINARRQSGDLATSNYAFSLNEAVAAVGKILVELIPKTYNTKRVVRMLGMDGSVKQVQIDPRQPQAVQDNGGDAAIRHALNPAVGRYDVIATVGQTFETQRQETLDSIDKALQSNPGLFQVVGDLFFKMQDAPLAQAMAERVRRTMPPEVLGDDEMTPEEKQKREQSVAQMQQQMQQMQQNMEQLQQAADRQAADNARAQAEQQKAQAMQLDAENKARELDLKQKQMQIDVARMAAELQLKVESQQADNQKATYELQLRHQDANLKAVSHNVDTVHKIQDQDSKLEAHSMAMKHQAKALKETGETGEEIE